MKALIILMYIITWSAAFETPESDTEDLIQDNLMHEAGYPKPGDIPTLNRKVFKGKRVSIREHPYTVSVRRLVAHYVTGALLTRNLVITVAHAVFNVPVTELGVVVGENYCDRGSMVHTVVLVIIHSDFNPNTLQADIALLRFYEEISYKGNVKSIRLVSPFAELNGEKALVTGWGRCDNMGTELCLDRTSRYYPDEKLDPMLRTISFTMQFPNGYCEGYKRHDVTLYPGMLCTGIAREEEQTCPCLGVPGAVLVTSAHLAGLLSWGFGCGYSYDLPLVYTSMQFYSSWIAHNIRIMHMLKHGNITALFTATKAYVLAQWLIETRVVTPELHIRTDKTMEPMFIDNLLVLLKGSVYDVRDFISDGKFREEKRLMYESIADYFVKQQSTTSSPLIQTTVKLAPFIGNETLNEIGFDMGDIIKARTDSTTESR